VNISYVRRDVTNTHTVVANTHTVVGNTHIVVSNTHTLVSEIHRSILQSQEETDGRQRSVSAIPIHQQKTRNAYYPLDASQVSELGYHGVRILTPTSSVPPGESPPPPPRACFGRDELIDKIVGLAENLTPIALIGPGGIGKTSVALAVLHDNRVKRRFGENRRFIRCDQLSASRANFLSRLSEVIGADVKNPEDLAPLRPFLSSKEMVIVFDNAESVLDPQGAGAREIYAVVEELSQFETICLCITSRISIIPPDCETLDIPILSMESARDAFYRIYKNGERPDLIDRILEQLEFHPLSITLLATVAHHNKWDSNRLAREWGTRRTQVLRTDYNESLAATIELSLASPMFRELGPDARDLLGVVAFFPQGLDENNLDWFFPTSPDRRNILDKLCVLSLTYRSDSFITMLAPLRDYVRPEDPASSPLLHVIKARYVSRLSVDATPGAPDFEEARWITSEDMNVEYLLDVFTSIDSDSVTIWNAYASFMRHLCWLKPRPVMLGPKIERLPDNHPSKPKCLYELSQSFNTVGNLPEHKRLLVDTLELWRERGDDLQVAMTLRFLASVNQRLLFYKEGVPQAEESLEIYERLNDVWGQVRILQQMALLLYFDNQLNAAAEAASRSINLRSDNGEQFPIWQGHCVLGGVCHSKGEAEAAENHFNTALRIASSSNWHGEQFSVLYSLAELFYTQGNLEGAHACIGCARPHTNAAYYRGRAMELQARIWFKQGRLEEAESEALNAVEIYGKLGATKELEDCRKTLQLIEAEMEKLTTSGELDSDGELLGMVLPSPPTHSPSLPRE
jgi:tetratricopeptide (TPR) repeat protein